MKEYVYPAVFAENGDGSYTVTYPDLPGCITEGKSLANAMYMAQLALGQWCEYMTGKNEELPEPSPATSVKTGNLEFVNLVRADVRDNRAVRRTVSIPKWMDDKVSEFGLSLSRVLQDAIVQRIS